MRCLESWRRPHHCPSHPRPSMTPPSHKACPTHSQCHHWDSRSHHFSSSSSLPLCSSPSSCPTVAAVGS